MAAEMLQEGEDICGARDDQSEQYKPGVHHAAAGDVYEMME